MITKQQAQQLTSRDELHAGECIDTIGPRGGRTSKREVWRVNGAFKEWKRGSQNHAPGDWHVPLKYGFNGPYCYLTQDNAIAFHLASECKPIVNHIHASGNGTITGILPTCDHCGHEGNGQIQNPELCRKCGAILPAA